MAESERERRENEWFLSRFDEITEAVAPRCTDPAVNEAYRLVFAQRAHIGADHLVMVQLGRIADVAVQMLEHVNMDTDEDRELHARAVGALRGRLDEMAATMKEANEAARNEEP